MLQYSPRLILINRDGYVTMPASVNNQGGYFTMSVSVNVLTEAVAGLAALPRITEAGNRAARLEAILKTLRKRFCVVVFPNTSVKALGVTPSDHCLCLVSFSTAIPRSKIFRFKIFWLQHSGFMDVLSQSWVVPVQQTDHAKALTTKFNLLRMTLKEWQAGWSSLKDIISNAKLLLQFLELLGEYRDLSLEEWNFKNILKDHLLGLIEQQRIY